MSRPITPEVRRRVWANRVLALGALLLVVVGYGIIVNVYFMDDAEDDVGSSGNRPCAGLEWPESSDCASALGEWRRQSPSFDPQAEYGGEASVYARIADLTDCEALYPIAAGRQPETTNRGYRSAAYDRMKAIGCFPEFDLLDHLLPGFPPPPPAP